VSNGPGGSLATRFHGDMPTRLDADRWGDLDIIDVAPLDMSPSSLPGDASWWCGRCGDDHPLTTGSVVKVRSHLGVSEQIACERCARVAERRAAGRRPQRVLLIDDSADFRDLVRRLLEQDAVAEVIGYVADGREALVEIARLRPDVVILDLAMPRLDGMDLLPQLPDDVAVIVLSGRSDLREQLRDLRRDLTILPKQRDSLVRLVELLAGPP
jgi:CheY-like chemotaxis protein